MWGRYPINALNCGSALIAACLCSALACFWLIRLELTAWQLLVSLIAAATLGFQLLGPGFLRGEEKAKGRSWHNPDWG